MSLRQPTRTTALQRQVTRSFDVCALSLQGECGMLLALARNTPLHLVLVLTRLSRSFDVCALSLQAYNTPFVSIASFASERLAPSLSQWFRVLVTSRSSSPRRHVHPRRSCRSSILSHAACSRFVRDARANGLAAWIPSRLHVCDWCRPTGAA